MNRLIRYIILLSVLGSCQKILFNEEELTREIIPGDFSSVDVRGIFEIILIQDSTDRIVITGRNGIHTIDAKVENGILKIVDPVINSFNIKRNTLSIHFTSIENLTTWNPVRITGRDTLRSGLFTLAAVSEVAEVSLAVDCGYLVVASANSLGNFNISGKADYLFIETWYGCSILAEKLTCRQAEIRHGSAGDVYVSATETISAHILGPGNIYYHGNPETQVVERSGTGKLIRLD